MHAPIAILLLAAAVIFAAIPGWSRMLQHRQDVGIRAQTECRSLVAAFKRDFEIRETIERNMFQSCLLARMKVDQ
jgi:hypothetical protein